MENAYIRTLLSKAYELRYAGQFSEALESLQPLLELKPPPATALVLAAECFSMMGNRGMDEIEGLLRSAVELAPDYVDAKLELGHFLSTWRDEA